MNEDGISTIQEEFRKLIKDSQEFRFGSRLNATLEASRKKIKYLPFGAELRILTRERCNQIIGGLVGSEDPESDAAKEPQIRSHCDKVFGFPGLCIILLTVISYGTFQTLKLFHEKFLEHPCGKDDSHLPFDKDSVTQHFGSDPNNHFFDGQFAYLAVTLTSGAFRQEYQASRIFHWRTERS